MNVAKNGLARVVSVKACESLVDGIAKLNLNELKEKPDLVDTLKKQLIEENNELRQQIEQTRTQLKQLQAKLPKNVTTEEYPLKTPSVLNTNRISGDRSSTKDENAAAESKDVVATKQPKEQSNKKETKPKGGNKQAAKEPENDKIDSSRLNLLVGKVVEVSVCSN